MSGSERLPSTRELAEQLHVSRTVVVLAYEGLLAEGFVQGRGGSGTYVAEGLGARRTDAPASRTKVRLSRFGAAAQAAVLNVDTPGLAFTGAALRFRLRAQRSRHFPLRNVAAPSTSPRPQAPVRELDYGPAAGSVALREAIATHLRRARAVVCDPSQVIVVNGSQQALDLIARVLDRARRSRRGRKSQLPGHARSTAHGRGAPAAIARRSRWRESLPNFRKKARASPSSLLRINFPPARFSRWHGAWLCSNGRGAKT